MGTKLAHAAERVAHWRDARARTGAMLVALDFDGTLVALKDQPGDVFLPEDVQGVLRLLEARADTRVALLSGRSLEDVEARVGVSGIVYAGNHGLEIRGPRLQLVHESALAARQELERALVALRVSVKAIEGAHVEDKRLSLAVHYRQAGASNAEQMLRERVTDVLLQFTQLRCAEGKKIFEIVPAIQWDKGCALEWIRRQLRIPASAPVVFLGDDRTDEDAFRVVAADGGGIIVADPPPSDTSASYFLRSPAEVIEFLRLLAQL